MTHRSTHCSSNGHRGSGGDLPDRVQANGTGGGGGAIRGVKLFGVRLTDGLSIKKSASMGCLSVHLHANRGGRGSGLNRDGNPSAPANTPGLVAVDGYLSDDPANHGNSSSARRGDRKKGVPWTEEEHRMFLIGLQKLGKGDWRGISRHFVVSRTATQVASHAQKYFIRQSNTGRRKRRSSLFDMPPDTANNLCSVHEDAARAPRNEFDTKFLNSVPSLDLSLGNDSSLRHAEPGSCDTMTNVREQAVVHLSSSFPSLMPG
ncbi:hypothetical protein MLD38_005232 [Melastoma candidum]|uniref:Uncharacterized protein n=1 Tax=Melastoma candidum TaxID=119954 RepID=A0ACB9SC37_9MYRT|nr:hypothetical protein MLD38_005232 [Melastoma candidum]